MRKAGVVAMSPSMFNAFQILGLKVDFDLKPCDLEHAYLRAMQISHPDQQVAKPLDHNASSLDDATLVNQAYRQLKDPHRRAQHCLQLQGISSQSSQAPTSQGILIESMTMRESLQEAHTCQAIDHLCQHVQDKKKQILTELTLALKRSEITQACHLTEHLGYLNKFYHEAQTKKWALEDTHLLMENTNASSAA